MDPADDDWQETVYFLCWDCQGEGGYHDCGEDCCRCLDDTSITHDCWTCGGKGWLPIPEREP
jgi:hypothetical protein